MLCRIVLIFFIILRGLSSYYILARNYWGFISRINYIIQYSTAKLFAAKFRLSSIAKVFARVGNLSKPINNKVTKSKKSVIGQIEEKIYAYLKTIRVSLKKMKHISKISLEIPYTTFNKISKPNLALLKKDFNLTLGETLTLLPKSRHINSLNSLNWRITRTVKLFGAAYIIYLVFFYFIFIFRDLRLGLMWCYCYTVTNGHIIWLGVTHHSHDNITVTITQSHIIWKNIKDSIGIMLYSMFNTYWP